MFDAIEEAIFELQQGRVVIVCDDENRENEGDLVALAEKVTPEMINFMSMHGRGLICMPITEHKANELDFHPMVQHNTDAHHTAFTVSVDHESTKTGISAFERSETIARATAGDAEAGEFNKPGHIFPLIAKEGGVFERAGHTEAAVDLARVCGCEPAGVICEVMNDDGSMARVPDLRQTADRFNLKMMTIKDLIAYRKRKEKLVQQEVTVDLPTQYGYFRAVGYSNRLDEKEHVALVKGDLSGENPVLVRVHSECMTGDVFGSVRCDCGPQLHEALSQIEEEGRGVFLYMRQEGRGIGLLNKLRAYKLQESGFDTVEANEQLGFPPDLREYGIGAQILSDLGVKNLRLLTNNPRKVTGLEAFGLNVTERVPIQVALDKENERYLRTKRDKLGHLLQL